MTDVSGKAEQSQAAPWDCQRAGQTKASSKCRRATGCVSHSLSHWSTDGSETLFHSLFLSAVFKENSKVGCTYSLLVKGEEAHASF